MARMALRASRPSGDAALEADLVLVRRGVRLRVALNLKGQRLAVRLCSDPVREQTVQRPGSLARTLEDHRREVHQRNRRKATRRNQRCRRLERDLDSHSCGFRTFLPVKNIWAYRPR